MEDCGTDVLVSFTESLHVFPGLLTAATVCGGLTGILTAALLYVYCLKPLLLTRQGYNARRLLEPDDEEVDHHHHHHHHSDCVSHSRKEAASGNTDDKERKQPLINNEVAAFASRAKVIYPINQKYRPLADGASNPSLHEHSKIPAVDNEDSSSSTIGESLSQEQDNDDSSQFISSSQVPKSLQNQSFHRVSHYPCTLTQGGFEGRISLYFLALQDLQHLCSQLQEEKHLVSFARIQYSKSVHRFCFSFPQSKGFSRQVEDLCQHVLRRSSPFSSEEAQKAISFLTQTLLLVETNLMREQEAQLTRIQMKLLWWEELTALIQSQPALLRWEVTLRQGVIATVLEQLTSDDVLKFSHMEEILSEIQDALTEGLQQCNEECSKKTNELVKEKCSKKESRRKKLERSQTKERTRTFETKQTHCDPQEITKVYQDLLLKQRQEMVELEFQQDNRVADALCDLWKKLHTSCSKRLGEVAKEVFLTSVPAQTKLSAGECETLWLSLEQVLAAQLHLAENTIRQQLLDIRTQLNKDGEEWAEGASLLQACLKHLGEQQMKILQATVAKQSYTINSETGMLIEKKHEQLLVAVQRNFVVRHFNLHILREMRLSKLKVLSQTDYRALLKEDLGKNPPCVNPTLKSSSASLAERHLGPESQLLTNSLQQEFLSELETGSELLQNHAQLLLGNALSHAVQQMMEAIPTASNPRSKEDDELKHHLTEAAAESVYITKDSLTSLVQNYYSQLQDINHRLMQDESNSNQSKTTSLMKELVNWSKKPASAEFQQRVELYKKKVLEQCNLDQKGKHEELMQRKAAEDQTMMRIKEESLVSVELTALARISVCFPDSESSEDDNTGNGTILDLLTLNPALDPALNPSLTPSFVTPRVKSEPKQKRERESHIK
uniref:Ellis-van Creveld syndrome protein n=1 Tax=Gouania willdenowi TaxID=441366 RepID=A0A8C5E854_GOUWI